MIATRAMIASFRVPGRQQIDRDLETIILTRFGTEPLPYEYSEQDLSKQIRKLIDRYNEGGIPGIPF